MRTRHELDKLKVNKLVKMDEEEIAIMKYSDLCCGNIPIIYNQGNPFLTQDPKEMQKNKDKIISNFHMAHNAHNKLSLMERNSLNKPNVIPCETRSTKLVKTGSASTRGAKSLATVSKKERKQTMNEFVQQKREIYIRQIAIDRCHNKIKNLNNTQKKIISQYNDLENQIVGEYEQNQTFSIQMTEELMKARALEKKTYKQRLEKEKQLKVLESNVEKLRSEIFKNEEPLESMRQYQRFLEIFVPDGLNTLEYFITPKKLIEELELIESANVFLIKQCRHFEDSMQRASDDINRQVQSDLVTENEILMKIDETNILEAKIVELEPKNMTMTDIDKELYSIRDHINQTYTSLFGKHTEINSLEMLEHIESRFQEMHRACHLIDHNFLCVQESIKKRSRREQHRIQMIEQMDQEQKRKMSQAIERAQKPIYRKQNRKIHQRILPITMKREDPNQINMQVLEEQRQNDLLFGFSEE